MYVFLLVEVLICHGADGAWSNHCTAPHLEVSLWQNLMPEKYVSLLARVNVAIYIFLPS